MGNQYAHPNIDLAVELFTKALASKKPFKIKAILRKAGYSESSVQQSTKVMGPIRERLGPILQEMEDHRDEILEQMKKKVKKANYADLVRGFDVMTYNIQLLGGKPTANLAIGVEHRHRLDTIIEK